MRIHVRKEHRERLLSFGICMYCGDVELLEIEHIIPCNSGGSSELDNLTVACAHCNAQKGTHSIENFLSRIFHKRDKTLNSVFTYIRILDRCRKKQKDEYLQKQMIEKIIECRRKHSYYTRIIHSILTEKYRLQ